MDSSQNPSGASTPVRHDVWTMFDRIAHRYDLLNRLLSFGQDLVWRARLSRCLPTDFDQRVLDVATGTADQLISVARRCRQMESAVGLDMSREMLEIGQAKLRARPTQCPMGLIHGNGLQIPLRNETVGAITISFGIRNMTDVSLALEEMYRVLKPGGKLIILEFSLPGNYLFRTMYLTYFRYILPVIGSLISGDNYAYRYLNRTVETFPYGQDFSDLMNQAGFKRVELIPLTFGIATIYNGEKVDDGSFDN